MKQILSLMLMSMICYSNNVDDHIIYSCNIYSFASMRKLVGVLHLECV